MATDGEELLEAILEELGTGVDELLTAMLDDTPWLDDESAWLDDEGAWLDDESAWLEDSCAALDVAGVELDCATLLEEPFVPMQALSARVAVPSIAARKWPLSRCFNNWFNMDSLSGVCRYG